MKVKIRLDTHNDAVELVGLATGLDEPVYLKDGSNFCVSAKSLLGTLCARFDFTEIWLETKNDHYFKFRKFIVEE